MKGRCLIYGWILGRLGLVVRLVLYGIRDMFNHSEGVREKRMRGEEQLQGDEARGKHVMLRMPLHVRG